MPAASACSAGCIRGEVVCRLTASAILRRVRLQPSFGYTQLPLGHRKNEEKAEGCQARKAPSILRGGLTSPLTHRILASDNDAASNSLPDLSHSSATVHLPFHHVENFRLALEPPAHRPHKAMQGPIPRRLNSRAAFSHHASCDFSLSL